MAGPIHAGKPHNYAHFAVLGSAREGKSKGWRLCGFARRQGNCPTEKRSGMRKRKYLIGALLSVIGALVVSSSAQAAVTSQTLSVVASPPKQDKKVFGPVSSFANDVGTNYSGGFTPVATQTVLTYSKDFK